MPFLSNYFELNNILTNHPPKVTVIFHEKRIGILSKLQKVIKPQSFLIHKKVPESGLVSKFIAESHRRHEIPKHKIDSFLFENVNFLDGEDRPIEYSSVMAECPASSMTSKEDIDKILRVLSYSIIIMEFYLNILLRSFLLNLPKKS